MLQNYFTFLLIDKKIRWKIVTLPTTVFLLSPRSSSNNLVGIKPTLSPNLTKQFICPCQFFNKLLKYDLQGGNAFIGKNKEKKNTGCLKVLLLTTHLVNIYKYMY